MCSSFFSCNLLCVCVLVFFHVICCVWVCVCVKENSSNEISVVRYWEGKVFVITMGTRLDEVECEPQ